MKEYFELIHLYNLSKFIVNVYKLKSSDQASVSSNDLESIKDILDQKEYPRGIVEILQNYPGVAKIEVFDSSNNRLLNYEVFIR